MKPSSASTFTRLSLTREAGTSTRSWPARIPLRRRFKRSVIGSLVAFIASPRSLQDAGQVARRGVLAETDPAEAELPKDAARPAADAAAAHFARHELRLPRRLDDHCSSGHISVLSPLVLSPWSFAEGHSELLQEHPRAVVLTGGGDDRHVQALRLV